MCSLLTYILALITLRYALEMAWFWKGQDRILTNSNVNFFFHKMKYIAYWFQVGLMTI